MRKGLAETLKQIREVRKGTRGGKYVSTPSGRKVYIKDNGSSYIHQNPEKTIETNE